MPHVLYSGHESLLDTIQDLDLAYILLLSAPVDLIAIPLTSPQLVQPAMDTNTLTNQMRTEVTMYSIVVGLSILVLCVAPCVLFALLSKCFQSQSPRRRVSILL